MSYVFVERDIYFSEISQESVQIKLTNKTVTVLIAEIPIRK